MIFIAIEISYADFGQSAGMLDFGKLAIGENKTLSYLLVNTGDELIKFNITHPNDTIVNPVNGTIRAHGQMQINVTVAADKIGNFSGVIKAKAIENISGVVVFNVELDKNYKYSVVEKEKGDLTFYLTAAIVIFLMFFAVYYYKLKGGKKKWKFGK